GTAWTSSPAGPAVTSPPTRPGPGRPASRDAPRPPPSGGPDEQTGRSALADRPVLAADRHRELVGRALHVPHLNLGARHEPLVVEPAQQLAVVLGEPDDRRPGRWVHLGQRAELAVLGLLVGGIHRPAVGAAVRPAQ